MEIRDNNIRAKNAILFFYILFVYIAISILINIYCYIDTNGGQKIFDQTNYSLKTSINIKTIYAIFFLPVNILAIVFFIMWFRRSYFNLHQLNLYNLKYTEGWASGAWFTPILNLYAPSRIMREIIEDTKDYVISLNNIFESSYKNLMPYLNWWWGLWITSNIIINGVTRYGLKASAKDSIAIIPIEIIGDIINLISGIILVIIIKESQKVQDALYEMRDEANKEVLNRLVRYSQIEEL